jgi:hypothetical protein
LFPFDPALRGGVDLRQVPVQRTAGEGILVQERYKVDAAGTTELVIVDLENGYEYRQHLGPVDPFGPPEGGFSAERH